MIIFRTNFTMVLKLKFGASHHDRIYDILQWDNRSALWVLYRISYKKVAMDFEYVYVIVLLLLSVTLTDCVPQTSDSGSEINI